MKDGAVGLSTGLIYIPGTYSKTGKYRSGKVSSKIQWSLYYSHMRDEGDNMSD